MRSFLRAWLTEAPEVLARELAGEAELRPSAQLPQLETATTLAITAGEAALGRFLVTADRYALHALLAAASRTDGSLDAERDRALWSGILLKIAESALGEMGLPPSPGKAPAIEDAEWTLGLPSAAWELRLGETVLLLAFTDEMEFSPLQEDAPETAKQEAQTEPADEAIEERATRGEDFDARAKPAMTSEGVELLLDVELEASLRFGSREMPLNEVLDLGAGDVVELDRHVSDPVDLLVGDKIVARGEVVLVNGGFGLRVLEVAEPRKRLESIRCLF